MAGLCNEGTWDNHIQRYVDLHLYDRPGLVCDTEQDAFIFCDGNKRQ